MGGKRLLNLAKSLISPKSYLWGVLVVVFIGVIIWLKESPNPKTGSNKLNIQVDWKTTNVDDPLDEEVNEKGAKINLKEQSKRLLENFRQQDPDSKHKVLEDIKKSPEDARASGQVNEMDLNQPIAQKKAPEKPQLVLLLHGLGFIPSDNIKAAEELDPAISFSYLPYAKDLQKYMEESRQKGHELLMAIPMETMSYPQEDPGPKSLLTGLSPQENIQRLLWALDKAKGCVGVCNFLGSRFTAVREELSPILKEIKRQGFVFLDTKAANRSQVAFLSEKLQLPHLVADITIYLSDPHDVFIEKMEKLIELTLKNDQAVGVIESSPQRIDHLIEWQKDLEGVGLDLAPISQIIQKSKQKKPENKKVVSKDVGETAPRLMPETEIKQEIVSEIEEEKSGELQKQDPKKGDHV